MTAVSGSPSSQAQLSGDAKHGGGITASPSSIDFGSVRVGDRQTQTETLTNNAVVGVTIYSSDTTGAGFSTSGLSLPLTLAPGGSFTFSTTFAPQASGQASGSVTLSSRNGHRGLAIPVTGAGTAAGELQVSPPALNFGNVTVGSTSRQSGSLSAAGSSITVLATILSSSEFSVSGLSFPFTIAAGRSMPFTVAFAPQASGAASATASFVSNASNSPSSQSLTGTGVPGPLHSVDLSWSENSPGIAGYNIYRGAKSGGPYTRINVALDASTAYTDSLVSAGHTYFYVTTAVDSSSNESTYSNEVPAVIPTP